MPRTREGPSPGGRDGPGNTSCLDGIDDIALAPRTTPSQAEFLRAPHAVREAKLELLREAAHETCGFIRIHAEVCQSLAETGDNAGLLHSLGRLVLYAKEAGRHGNELRAIREGPR